MSFGLASPQTRTPAGKPYRPSFEQLESPKGRTLPSVRVVEVPARTDTEAIDVYSVQFSRTTPRYTQRLDRLAIWLAILDPPCLWSRREGSQTRDLWSHKAGRVDR